MSEILCPECHEPMGTLTPYHKEDNKNIFMMSCAKCQIQREIDIREYEWSFECPFCGGDTYDPRGKAYQELLTRSLGHCPSDDCPGRTEKQAGLNDFSEEKA